MANRRLVKDPPEQEALWGMFLESTSAAIIGLDTEGNCTFANLSCLEMLGYEDAGELVGRSIHKLIHHTYRDGSPCPKKECSIYRSLLKGKGTHVDSELLWRSDGTSFEVEYWSHPILSKGSVTGAVVTFLDITDRRKAEEALESSKKMLGIVLDTIPVRVFWKDRELRYLGCNVKFAHDAGLKSPRELIGKDDFQMSWKDEAELYRADDRAVMDSGVAKLGYKEQQQRPDGTVLQLKTSKVPLRDNDGNVFGVMGTYEDITEAKKTEEALQALVESTVVGMGQEFFDRIVRSLGEWLGTECVIVGLTGGEGTIDVISMVLDGEPVNGFSYPLSDAPCEIVTKEGFFFLPSGVCDVFPEDKELVNLGAEGYMGAPLKDKDGAFIGVLCAISRSPMKLPPRAREVFEVIAARAGVEVERKRGEEALQALVESTVGGTAGEFFDRIVRSLGEWLGTECVIVGREHGEGTIGIISMILDGKLVDGFSYPLSGTPCERVSKDGFLVFPNGVQELFPSDEDLVKMGAEGYMGAPIKGKGGTFIGVLCAISRSPMKLPPRAREVFEVIAARAGVELERKRAEEALVHKKDEVDRLNDELHRLILKISNIEDKERKYFSEMLHDVVGQNLVGIKLGLESGLKRCCPEGAENNAHISKSLSLLGDTIQATRSMTAELYPSILDNMGLVSALEWYTQRVMEALGIKVVMHMNAGGDALDEDAKRTVFRFAKECFQNITKHARAKNVELTCRGDDGLIELSISDDGMGFDTEAVKGKGQSLGFMLMREWATSLGGKLDIRSKPGRGTLISLELPLVQEAGKGE